MIRILYACFFSTFFFYYGCKQESVSINQIEFKVDSSFLFIPKVEDLSWYEKWKWKDSLLHQQIDQISEDRKKFVVYQYLQAQGGFDHPLSKDIIDSFLLNEKNLEPVFDYYYGMNAAIYYWGSQWDTVISSYMRCKDIGDSIFVSHPEKFKAERWLGHIYTHYLTNIDSAELYFKHVLNASDNYLANGEMRFEIYSDMIQLYLYNNDSQTAESYGELALKEAQEYNLDSMLISEAYARLGNVYYSKQDLVNARINYEKYTGNDPRIISNLAIIYTNLERFDDAGKLMERISAAVVSDDDTFRLNRLKGIYFATQNKYLEAVAALQKCRNLDKDFRYSNSGDVYNLLSKMLGNLHRYDEALSVNTDLFKKLSFDLEKPDLTREDVTLLQALVVRTRVLLDKGVNTHSSKSLLELLKVYEIVKAILSEFKGIMDTDSYLNSIANYYEANENAISALYSLYESSDNTAYLSKLIEEMETFKGSLLIMDRKRDLIESSDIGLSELLRQEQNLQHEINRLKTIKERDPSPENNERFLSTHSRKSKLQKQLKSNYPQYYSKVYVNASFGLEDFKNLAKQHQSIVAEYYLGKDFGLAIVSDGDDLKTFKIPLPDVNIIPLIDSLRKTLKPGLDKNYKKYSYQLYERLHLNKLDQFNSEKLILIQDAELFYLPFELLVSDLGGNRYLVHDYQISYSFTAKTAANYNPIDFSQSDKSAIIYSYSDKETLKKGKDHLGELHHGYEESLEIKDALEGYNTEIFSGESATKEHFLKNAPNYDICHLILHGVSGTDSRFSSKIYFRGDTTENILFSYEIAEIPQKFDLICLSSCESGYGTSVAGEGVYSMARAFAGTGVQDIVSSLWKLDDYSGKEIVSNFYKNLRASGNVSEALRLSKIQYLDMHSGDELRPYFWAGLVHYIN